MLPDFPCELCRTCNSHVGFMLNFRSFRHHCSFIDQGLSLGSMTMETRILLVLFYSRELLFGE